MKYHQFVIFFLFYLFFVTITFGQNSIEDIKPKIKSIEKLIFDKNNLLDGISYETFNFDEKITSYVPLESDSTQSAQAPRRLYKYNNKGLLEYEELYKVDDDTLPSTKIETIYDKTYKIIQKRTFSDFKKQKILDENGIIIAEKTISSSGKIINRELYIYDNDLLIEIRHLDENDNSYMRQLFKYNKLKQNIEEIKIRNNITVSKAEYKYNNKGRIKVRSYFIEKKLEVKSNKIAEVPETEEAIEVEIFIDTTIVDETEESYPSEWKDWKEKKLDESITYFYNEYDDVFLNITKEGNQLRSSIYEITYEYDKNHNWVKEIVQRNKSHWRKYLRKIEYH